MTYKNLFFITLAVLLAVVFIPLIDNKSLLLMSIMLLSGIIAYLSTVVNKNLMQLSSSKYKDDLLSFYNKDYILHDSVNQINFLVSSEKFNYYIRTWLLYFFASILGLVAIATLCAILLVVFSDIYLLSKLEKIPANYFSGPLNELIQVKIKIFDSLTKPFLYMDQHKHVEGTKQGAFQLGFFSCAIGVWLIHKYIGHHINSINKAIHHYDKINP